MVLLIVIDKVVENRYLLLLRLKYMNVGHIGWM